MHSSPSNVLLEIIVQKAETSTDLATLVRAYVDELLEEWQEYHGSDVPNFDRTSEAEEWMGRELGVLYDPREIENEYNETFVREYRRLNRHATREAALGVSELPPGLPSSGVPASLLHALAEEQAHKDAHVAHALRELALSRR